MNEKRNDNTNKSRDRGKKKQGQVIRHGENEKSDREKGQLKPKIVATVDSDILLTAI